MTDTDNQTSGRAGYLASGLHGGSGRRPCVRLRMKLLRMGYLWAWPNPPHTRSATPRQSRAGIASAPSRAIGSNLVTSRVARSTITAVSAGTGVHPGCPRPLETISRPWSVLR